MADWPTGDRSEEKGTDRPFTPTTAPSDTSDVVETDDRNDDVRNDDVKVRGNFELDSRSSDLTSSEREELEQYRAERQTRPMPSGVMPSVAQPDLQRNVGPNSDPNLVPARLGAGANFGNDEALVPERSFGEQADEWLEAKRLDLAADRNAPDWSTDYPDWTVWRTDDRHGMFHAAHKDSVGYYQVGDEDSLREVMDNYGKVDDNA